MTEGQINLTPVVMLVGENAQSTEHRLQHALLSSADWRWINCQDVEAAIGTPPPSPDLVVLAPGIVSSQPDALFEHAKRLWPQTSFLLVTSQPLADLGTLLERHGNMAVCTPDVLSLSRAIEREVTGLSHGSLRGLSLPGLLQMMEWDHKSLAIRVQSARNWGRLHLRDGRLVDAYTHAHRQIGEAAALDILAWDGVSMTLERSYHNQQTVIDKPLAPLLMEAMQRKDETATHTDSTSTGEFNAADFDFDDLIIDDGSEDDMLFRKNRKANDRPSGTPPNVVAPDVTPLGEDTPFQALKETDMANVKETLDSALHGIDGAMAAALVDYTSGMALGMAGSGVNLEMAAAGNTEVVRAKLRTMESLGIKGTIEDILITLDQQYHVIYLVPGKTLFLYLVLNKAQSNLAMARYKLKAVGAEITV